MNFASLDDSEKLLRHKQLVEYTNSYGGINAFLQLIEAMRANNPHPLINKNCNFYFSLGSVRWNKVVFKDKLTLLMKARSSESKNNNLLPNTEDKSYKSVMNLVKTLSPIEFVVKPKNIKDGEGFTFKPFEQISESVIKLNPIFDALFFSSIDSVKKVLNFQPVAE
jgi:hypothetical protein